MRRAVPAAAFAAALIPFLPALGAGFLDWDDKMTLVFHDAWRGFDAARLRWMLSSSYYGPWQPLSWLSYAADHALWGLDAPAFRRTNLVLHAAAAALLAACARRILDEKLPKAPERARALGALAAALVFALHPLRAESVVWITERRDVLSGALLLGSLLARLEKRNRLALGLFAGALMSKGTAVALPFFLLALEPKKWKELLPYFALAGAAGAVNVALLGGASMPAPWLAWWQKLAMAAHSAGFYFAKTLAPVGLSPYYALPRDWAAVAPRLAAYGLLAAAVTAAAWAGRRRAPWALPAWLAYLAALAPVSGLLPSGGQLAADRYSYLPCLPFAVVAGGLAAAFASKRPRAAAALVAAAGLVLGAAAWRQSGYWRSDAALWTRAVEVEPMSYLPRSNLAMALLAERRLSEAVPQFAAAIALEPRDAPARFNLGLILLSLGEKEDGLALVREAVKLQPSLAERLKVPKP